MCIAGGLVACCSCCVKRFSGPSAQRGVCIWPAILLDIQAKKLELGSKRLLFLYASVDSVSYSSQKVETM